MTSTTQTRRNNSELTDIRIGALIKTNRQLHDMTLAELGTAIGCKHSTIANFESGRRTLTRERAHAIAQVFGVNPRLLNPDAA